MILAYLQRIYRGIQIYRSTLLLQIHTRQTSPWRALDITTLSVNAVCMVKESCTSIATTVVHEEDVQVAITL